MRSHTDPAINPQHVHICKRWQTIFSWAWNFWLWTEDDFLRAAGHDAVVWLRVLHMCFKVGVDWETGKARIQTHATAHTHLQLMRPNTHTTHMYYTRSQSSPGSDRELYGRVFNTDGATGKLVQKNLKLSAPCSVLMNTQPYSLRLHS